VQANHGFATIDSPVNQGSIRIVNVRFTNLKSDVNGCASGENVRRKQASAFRCLTISDMADHRRGQSGQATPEDEEARSSHHQLVIFPAPSLSAM
jgi:hypothetical protein